MPDANTNLRVLIVEDSDDDATLILRELRSSGYEPVAQRVESAAAMRAALSDKSWDIILCDYVIPGFSGTEALLIAKGCGLNLPFILVSGKVGEETAVEAMKTGATDFVMKDRLGRLGSVIKRELAEAATRRQAEAVRNRLAAIVLSSYDAIIGVDPNGIITSWNPGATQLYGYSAEEVVGKSVSMLAPSDKKDETQAFIDALQRGEAVRVTETSRIRKDGERIDVSFKLSPIKVHDGSIVGVSAIVRDVTEKKQAERALLKVNRALKVLSECDQALIHASDETQLLNDICRITVEVGGYRLACVRYAENDANSPLRILAQFGYDEGYLAATRISLADTELGRGPTGTAFRTGTIQVNQNFQTEPALTPWREAALAHGYQSSVALPLKGSAEVFGVLTVYAAEPNAVNEVELKLLQVLADDLAFGIKTLRARNAQKRTAERLQRSMEATIQAIASTVEMRDPYTAGHQRRVAELAGSIARDIGLTPDEEHGIYLASVVHDLGKIHIPAEILSMPRKLSGIEFEFVKTHPQVGYDILKDVDFPWPIAQMVLQHHERIDGSGYPSGLKGDEILLGAKILMVADVVEAMASHRPYRPAMGIELALAEISANAGKSYDTDVVRSCVSLFRDKKFVFTT
jgi:PAS domain S-box-containing protein